MNLGDLFRDVARTADEVTKKAADGLLPEEIEHRHLEFERINRRTPNVRRAIDREAGVVLYVSRGSDKGGIAAIPLDWTDLEPPEDEGDFDG